MSPLEECVEDEIISMAESGELPQTQTINVHFSEKEWEKVERFHRFRPKTRSFSRDRWPFIRMKALGINVNLLPVGESTQTPETIQ